MVGIRLKDVRGITRHCTKNLLFHQESKWKLRVMEELGRGAAERDGR